MVLSLKFKMFCHFRFREGQASHGSKQDALLDSGPPLGGDPLRDETWRQYHLREGSLLGNGRGKTGKLLSYPDIMKELPFPLLETKPQKFGQEQRAQVSNRPWINQLFNQKGARAWLVQPAGRIEWHWGTWERVFAWSYKLTQGIK